MIEYDDLIEVINSFSQLKQEGVLIMGMLSLVIFSFFQIPKTLVKIFVGSVLLGSFLCLHSSFSVFGGMVVQTDNTHTLTQIFLLFAIFLLFFKSHPHQSSTYYLILISAILASILLIKSRHFLLLYVSIEFLSLTSYLLTNFSFKKWAHEASIKYLIFGVVSSAFMLYGISLLYGVSGDLFWHTMSFETPFAKMGFIFFTFGLLFKAALVPFHQWMPDTYQAASVDTACFFSIVPKISALFVLIQIVNSGGWGQSYLLGIGLLTLTFGTLGSLKQRQIRRLISYGTWVHTAFLIPVLLVGSYQTFFWFTWVYVLMNLGVFYALEIMEKKEKWTLTDYQGIGHNVPLFAVLWVVILMALIGIPLTAGFTAKWLVWVETFDFFIHSHHYLWLVYFVVLVLATLFSLFYYLRIGYVMIFKKKPENITFSVGVWEYIFLFFVVFLLIFLFFKPIFPFT